MLGLFVGLLCGVVPFIFGLLTKHIIIGIVGAVFTVGSGIVFDLLEKSPFTAIGVALVFIIIIFTKSKNKHSHDDHDDHDIYFGDE